MRIMDGVAASVSECKAALVVLSEYLYHYYGKKVIILLDEYDTPMQEAYLNGYWDTFTRFISGLFNLTFKTNPYLERAVMTGITRVSRESVFSDFNNLAVVTTTTKKYVAAFGFTEEEVLEANTSSNSLVEKLMREAGTEIKTAVEDLLQNKTICVQMDEQIAFQELDVRSDAVWSFLLASGYLKITKYYDIDPVCDWCRDGLQNRGMNTMVF